MMYLGDYADDETVHFMWSTNAADGSSITRATNGTISVYKDDSTTQTTTGVTDTEDFDTLTGIHHCKIVTTDAFYTTATDYTVVLSAATIDGKTVNAVLAHFSIQNRYMRGTDSANTTTPPTAGAVADAVWDEAMSGHLTAGTTGEKLNTVSTPPAAATIADAVWDEAISGHLTAGTTGAILNSASAPTAGEVADAVWDEAAAGHTTAGTTGKALADAGAAGDPWNTAVPGAYTAGKAGYILGTYLDQAVSTMNQSPGAGAIEFTYTLTNADDATPIANADVWATSDLAGNTIIASGTTNASGIVTFWLDAGTVYIWRAKSGWNFTNPDTETVS
ncbi:MAG: hypothetical protein KBF17_07775 [Candidatus Promineofilum sp.]|nr:hypothetical protein [Promineifilum sp.]